MVAISDNNNDNDSEVVILFLNVVLYRFVLDTNVTQCNALCAIVCVRLYVAVCDYV